MLNIRLAALLSVIVILILAFTGMSCSDSSSTGEYNKQKVREIARPYSFSIASYEFHAVIASIRDGFSGEDRSSSEENILRGQIKDLLSQNGIPIFPPLNFSLEHPPHLLVISPRQEIVYLDRVVLIQQLTTDKMELLESQIDRLGYSSLVVELGGFGGTYPPIVDDKASDKFKIDAVLEEWLHQYLAFKPLGFLYLLDSIGIRQHPDVIVMNETLAGLVSRELGSEIYERYYQDKESNEPSLKDKKPDFDFNKEMRETRKQVDVFLAQGRIDEAERYMKDRREVFEEHGYQIRKLNQAYFAFHGIYGHDPASVSPINEDLKQLRAKSVTLKDFLDTTSAMKSYNDLKEALRD